MSVRIDWGSRELIEEGQPEVMLSGSVDGVYSIQPLLEAAVNGRVGTPKGGSGFHMRDGEAFPAGGSDENSSPPGIGSIRMGPPCAAVLQREYRVSILTTPVLSPLTLLPCREQVSFL